MTTVIDSIIRFETRVLGVAGFIINRVVCAMILDDPPNYPISIHELVVSIHSHLYGCDKHF